MESNNARNIVNHNAHTTATIIKYNPIPSPLKSIVNPIRTAKTEIITIK